MKKMLMVLFLICFVVPVASAEEDEWKISWDKNLKFSKTDGSTEIKLGGRIQQDFAVLAPSNGLKNKVPLNDDAGFGTEFRRVRIALAGKFVENVIFKTQYDFASKGNPVDDDTPGFKDVYIGVKGIPYFGTIKVGHMKEPLSQEMMQSSNDLTFMERGLSYMFVSDRNTGIRAENTAFDKNLTWQAGAFVPSGDKGYNPPRNDEFHLTARVTGTPIFEMDEKSAHIVHLGLGSTYQFGKNTLQRFAARPESDIAGKYINTGVFERGDRFTFGAEAGYVYDSFALQGEYMGTSLESSYLHGGYAEASYYLTGEHRNYNRNLGKFNNRVDPLDKKIGAWQVATRFSYLDANDNDIRGGTEKNVTAGVNWFYRKNLKISLNYVWADIAPGGDLNIVQARTQILF